MNFLTSLEIQKFRDQEDTELHKAAYEGDIKKINALLRDGNVVKGINQRNRLGCSPLRLAATGGHVEVLEALMFHGADVNLSDIKTQTPLYVAVKKHYLACVKCLLQGGANPDGDPRSLCTPIYLGAMDGWLQVIKDLVAYGADLDRSQIIVGSFNSTLLYISIRYRHLDCFRFLLRAGADPDQHLFPDNERGKRQVGACQSLYHAAVRHNLDVVFAEELYAFGASIYVRDDKKRLPYQLEQKNECSKYIMSLYDSPRTLLMQCRLRIRGLLGRRRLSHIPDLPLPSKVQAYLQFD